MLPAFGICNEKTLSTKWKLVWSDEFNGNTIDKTKWDFDIGNGFYVYDTKEWISGWGNKELQYYTREPENAYVRDGLLYICAMKESLFGQGYSSARLKTKDKFGKPLFSKKYGRFEFRAKLPSGKGIWPAFWMLPVSDVYGSWPASGEIDVMEIDVLNTTSHVMGSLHFGARAPGNIYIHKNYFFKENERISDFHIYSVEWEPNEIRWFVDDVQYSSQTLWLSSSNSGEVNAWPAPFDQPFYLIMNVAIASNVDKETPFPAQMVVDYVKVYDKVDGYELKKNP